MLSPGTQAVIKALQAELDVTATGGIDDAMVWTIDVKLDHSADDSYQIWRLDWRDGKKRLQESGLHYLLRTSTMRTA